ncbi:hypothetical protein SRABI106_04121 [Rahnella aquatilis]|nr:hypothetical protein SRABI106_04121 [Rahnella aquatilis]
MKTIFTINLETISNIFALCITRRSLNASFYASHHYHRWRSGLSVPVRNARQPPANFSSGWLSRCWRAGRSVYTGLRCRHFTGTGAGRNRRHPADVWRRFAFFSERFTRRKVDSHSRRCSANRGCNTAWNGIIKPDGLGSGHRTGVRAVSVHRQYRGVAAGAGRTATD